MLRAACLWLCWLVAGPALAGASDGDGLAVLERARLAALRLDYRGIYFHQRGPDVGSTRIVHRREGNTAQERLQRLDGPPSETLRRGDELTTYLPAQKRMLIERAGVQPGFPGLVALRRDQIERYYIIYRFDGDRVAGRPTTAIALDPRDAYHYGYRFWLDVATGLLLRVQTINEKGEVVEQVAFTELKTGDMPKTLLNPEVGDTRAWQVERVAARPVDLSAWRLGWVPGGFAPVASVQRTVGGTAGRGREVAQRLYSDGLAGLSVFIEPWTPERSASPLQMGALNMVGKRHGKFWLTIVGDVPMAAIRKVADAIEFADISPK
jgi:sigma-E factor negative regulatory protein RseB